MLYSGHNGRERVAVIGGTPIQASAGAEKKTTASESVGRSATEGNASFARQERRAGLCHGREDI